MGKVRQIDVVKLKKGMYIVDTLRGHRLTPPVYSVEGFILSSSEGKELRQRGFLYAFVNEARSEVDLEPDLEVNIPPQDSIDDLFGLLPQPAQPSRPLDSPDVPLFVQTVSYQEELRRAQELHVQALAAAKHMHETLEAGLSENTVAAIADILQNSVESLKRNENAMLSFARLKAADEYTFTHSVNVAMYAVVLGRRLNIKDSFLSDLAMAGFFHDIGKVLVPQNILHYPGPLKGKALEIMRSHAELGRVFLEHYPSVPDIARTGAIDHHERCDGSGYPMGKGYDDISLVGRLLAVVDVYDALTSRRCYKDAYTPAKSLSIMYNSREEQFSPGFVEALIEALGVYPVGSLVRLSNNYTAIVVEQNVGLALKPKVVTLIDAFGDKVDYPRLLNLEVHASISIIESVLSLPVEIDLEKAIFYATS